MITVEDLTVDRDGVRILSDVTFDVADGEFVGLVGPNGAGKTTLLQTINGILAPAEGHVTVDGVDVQASSARVVSQQVATVPQDASLAFDFAVEDVVDMGRTPYHSRVGRPDYREDRRMVDRALERTRTSELAGRSIGAVSGGERRRVLLARALAQDAPVLLLDEPTASLDINHQVRTLELVSDLVVEGKTALAAIHDLDLAARFCDRLLLLSNGRLLDRGTPESVLSADHLETAFDTEATVTTNPATGTPSVTAIRDGEARDLHVHALAGGALGARTVTQLQSAGLTVSVGPLPAGDLLVETARAGTIETVTAPAFREIETSVRDRVVELARSADVVLLANPPTGARQLLPRVRDVTPTVIAVEPTTSDADRSTERTVHTGSLGRPPDATTSVTDVVESVVSTADVPDLTADD